MGFVLKRDDMHPSLFWIYLKYIYLLPENKLKDETKKDISPLQKAERLESKLLGLCSSL